MAQLHGSTYFFCMLLERSFDVAQKLSMWISAPIHESKSHAAYTLQFSLDTDSCNILGSHFFPFRGHLLVRGTMACLHVSQATQHAGRC